jgi:hypothetical protein
MMEKVFTFSTWDVEDVGVLQEKDVSNVSSHSFQPSYNYKS